MRSSFITNRVLYIAKCLFVELFFLFWNKFIKFNRAEKRRGSRFITSEHTRLNHTNKRHLQKETPSTRLPIKFNLHHTDSLEKNNNNTLFDLENASLYSIPLHSARRPTCKPSSTLHTSRPPSLPSSPPSTTSNIITI